MKLPINWLKEYVKVPSSVDELTDKLTAIGHMQDHRPEKIGTDTVLDLEVRQNRSDCLSVVGLAREVAASLKTPLKLPKLDITLPKPEKTSHTQIQDSTAGYRFNSLQIDNIQIAPSPKWLVERLEAYGIKSINNLVDITNFVMVEQGEPLHAFDKKKIGKKIIVRFAKKNETIQVLGGRSIKLTPSDLVISDENKALAIAGIIGGVESSITDETTSITLEAATYNQAYIRRTSLRHSIRTEASLRHEKFLHPDLTEIALSRAAQLIVELCSGVVTSHDDAYVKIATPLTLTLSLPRLHMLSGIEIGMQDSLTILNDLGITAKKKSSDTISTQIPYFRTDINSEEDVIEEVLRIYGYEKIPDTLPNSTPPKEITSKSFLLEEEIRDILIGYGFDEIITEPLVNEETHTSEPVRLQNSLNADKTMLRSTLEHGLMSALVYQRKAKKRDVIIFEIGKIYFVDHKKWSEQKVLGGIISTPKATYLSTKGILEAVCMRVNRRFDSKIVTIKKIDTDTWYFEMKVEELLNQKPSTSFTIQTELPQIIYQDLSFSVPVGTAVGPLLTAVRKASPLVYKVSLGEKPFTAAQQRKNVFIKLQYHKSDSPLTTKDIDPVRIKILDMLAKQFEAVPR